MRAISRAEAPVAIEGDGVELRMQKLGGGMTTAFVRVPKGADFRPALAGLPDDLCQCPHWGYLIEGRVKMHTRDGEEVYEAGQAFYWAPGHAPEALEDSEYVDSRPPMSSTTSSTTSRRRGDRPAGHLASSQERCRNDSTRKLTRADGSKRSGGAHGDR